MAYWKIDHGWIPRGIPVTKPPVFRRFPIILDFPVVFPSLLRYVPMADGFPLVFLDFPIFLPGYLWYKPSLLMADVPPLMAPRSS